MTSSCSSEEQNLDAGQLNECLKEPLFVDYFNAFLALPTFPFKVKYNVGSGGFEEIISRSKSDISLVTSEVSLVNLASKNYITFPLEAQHSKPWVLRERLPLFIKSDLYSEYRLCRLLDHRTLPCPAPSCCDNSLPVASLPAGSLPAGSLPVSNVTFCCNSGNEHSVSPLCSPGRGRFGTDGVLRVGPSEQPAHCTAHSRCREQACGDGEQPGRLDSVEKVKRFKQYLHEKAGEKNWLFWVDCERLHYLTRTPDKAKWFKQVKNKYIRSGSPMQLPTELLLGQGVTKSSELSEQSLLCLQAVLLEALRTYWYPSFLVHLHCAQLQLQVASTQLQLPQMVYTGHKAGSTGGIPRTRSAGGHGSMPVAFRSRSKSSSRTTPTGQLGSRPRSYSASDVTIKADDFLAKSKQKGRTTPKLKKLKESAWTQDGQEVVEKCTKQEVVVASKHKKTEEGLIQMVANNLRKHLPASKEPHQAEPSPDRCFSKTKLGGKKAGKGKTKKLTPAEPPPPPGPPTVEDYHDLLRCLALEQWKAGGYFQIQLETTHNHLYLNCLMFWRELQQFKKLFYNSSFSPSAVEVKAKELHSQYIVCGASCDIGCCPAVRREVGRSLWPAFEELFDSAEEHALEVLMGPWRDLAAADGVECERKVMEQSSEPVSELVDHDSGTAQRGVASRGRSRGGSMLQAREWTLLDIIASPTESEYFKLFLNTRMAAVDLMCWLEIEAFRAIPVDEVLQRNMKARQIKIQFLSKKYFFGPNSPANKEQQRQVIAAQCGGYTTHLPPRPSTPVMIEAQKYVRARLDRKWLPMFINQPEFKSRNSSLLATDSEPTVNLNTAHPLLTVETQLALQSRDSITMRRCLADTKTKEGFHTYLSIQEVPGDKLVNNLHFYLEVQKFKDMYHNHTTVGMLEKKLRAVVSKYLESASPPSVQVDLHFEVVSSTLKKAGQMGPYVFREAQSAIFKVLMPHWTEFLEFVGEQSLSEVSFSALREKREADMQAAKKDQSLQGKIEEQIRSSVLRFETPDEKKKRKDRLKDQKEMGGGRIAISFRLSHPDQIITPASPPRKVSTAHTHKSSTPSDGIDDIEASSTLTSLATSSKFSCPGSSVKGRSPFSRASTMDSIQPMTALPEHGSEREVAGSRQNLELGQKSTGSRMGTPVTGSKSRIGTPLNGHGTLNSPVFMTQISKPRKIRRVPNPQADGPTHSSPKPSPTSSPHHTPTRSKSHGTKQAELGGSTYQWKRSSPGHTHHFGSGIDTSSNLVCVENTL